MKTWEQDLELARKNICIECGEKVEDFELEYCCSGHMCGCYGYPINVEKCLCDECLPKRGWIKNDL